MGRPATALLSELVETNPLVQQLLTRLPSLDTLLATSGDGCKKPQNGAEKIQIDI